MSLLATIALQVGAPLLAELFKRKGGAGGKIAGGIVETIAGELNVEPTPKAIKEIYDKNPTLVEPVLHKVEADLGVMAEAASKTMMSYHDLLEGDRNSDSFVNRTWRPLVGYSFAFCSSAVIAVIVKVLWKLADGVVIDLTNGVVLIGLVVPVLTLMAGVTGYFGHRRSIEKQAGVA